MKHIKKYNESIDTDFKIPFDENKYTIAYFNDIDLIPDTEFGVYFDGESDEYILVKQKDKDKLLPKYRYELIGYAVTIDYYDKALNAKEYYDEINDWAESIRSSDEQFSDSLEDDASEEYSKYFKKGISYDLYWDFLL